MIFFDIDNTLFDHSASTCKAAKWIFNKYQSVLVEPDRDKFVNLWFEVARKYNVMYLNNIISYEEHMKRRIRDVFTKNVTDESALYLFSEYFQVYEDDWTLFPDVLPCLAEFDKKELGIITNGQTANQRKKLRVLGLENRFEHVVISEEVGLVKPNPAIFIKACEIADRPQPECYYVGDRLDVDAAAARNAGLNGIWLNRRGIPADDNLGILMISTLAHLKNLTSR